MIDDNKNCLNCKYNVNKENKNYCLICSGFYNGTDEMCAEALCEKWEDAGMTGTMSLDMAIKALQQEDVIEKIRAEIAEYGSIWVAYTRTGKIKTDERNEKLITDVLSQAKRQVLDIIDKYREGGAE